MVKYIWKNCTEDHILKIRVLLNICFTFYLCCCLSWTPGPKAAGLCATHWQSHHGCHFWAGPVLHWQEAMLINHMQNLKSNAVWEFCTVSITSQNGFTVISKHNLGIVPWLFRKCKHNSGSCTLTEFPKGHLFKSSGERTQNPELVQLWNIKTA